MNNRYFSARRVTWFAILLALTVLLQAFGNVFQIGATRLSFTLVPIVVGGILLGPVAGMVLGLSFGLVVFVSALLGADPFTLYLFNDSPVMTLLIIFVKGAMAGLVPALVYKALKNKNFTLGITVSSILAPIVNTGLFIIGALMISGVINNFIVTNGLPEQSVIYFLIIGCAGINFLIELAINIILAPALVRIIKVVDKNF